MSRKFIAVGLILGIALLALLFSIRAGGAVFTYFNLKERVPIQAQGWSVQGGDDKYWVWVTYSYTYQNKNYQGEGALGKRFLNPWSAQKGLERYSQESWGLWINPEHPEKGAFEREFPYKKVISASLLILLALYFYGIYTRSHDESRRGPHFH